MYTFSPFLYTIAEHGKEFNTVANTTEIIEFGQLDTWQIVNDFIFQPTNKTRIEMQTFTHTVHAKTLGVYYGFVSKPLTFNGKPLKELFFVYRKAIHFV